MIEPLLSIKQHEGSCESLEHTLTATTLNSGLEFDLIRRVREGCSDAFRELMRPYERAVFVAALAIVKNEADAEDVSQEAVFKAFKGLGRFRHEAKFSTWLIQICINEAKMRLRKQRRYLNESLSERWQSQEGRYISRDFADWQRIPSEAFEQQELCGALTEALTSLSEKYRTVLILRDVEQINISETALALGISEANVKVRLCRARRQMRDAFEAGLGRAWSRESKREDGRRF